MTNRVPLIVNAGTSQIQELPSGDNLDLTSSSIVNLVSVTASGNATVGNVVASGYYWANGAAFVGGSGGSSTPSSIVNGGSQIGIASSGGNAVVQIGGVQTATFSQTSISMVGGISASGNISAGNVITTGGVYWSNGAAYSSGSGGGGGSTGNFTFTNSNVGVTANTNMILSTSGIVPQGWPNAGTPITFNYNFADTGILYLPDSMGQGGNGYVQQQDGFTMLYGNAGAGGYTLNGTSQVYYEATMNTGGMNTPGFMIGVVPSITNYSYQTQLLLTQPTLTLANAWPSGIQPNLAIGGNITSTGNIYGASNAIITGNVYAVDVIATQYGNSIGTTATYTGNVTAANVIATTHYGNSVGTTASYTSNVTVGGNLTVSGTNSNVVRRAFGLMAQGGNVTLDTITAQVTSSSQLAVYNSASWSATGWTETFTSGSVSVSSWVNLPIGSGGYTACSGAMGSQGNGCRMVFGDQTPSASMYEITVVRLGTSGAMWGITIERLV